jgi:hypothetical protein
MLRRGNLPSRRWNEYQRPAREKLTCISVPPNVAAAGGLAARFGNQAVEHGSEIDDSALRAARPGKRQPLRRANHRQHQEPRRGVQIIGDGALGRRRVDVAATGQHRFHYDVERGPHHLAGNVDFPCPRKWTEKGSTEWFDARYRRWSALGGSPGDTE